MSNSLMNQKRYEYHLSFVQTFGNPLGIFLYRCLAIIALCLQLYRAVFSQSSYDPATSVVAWVIVVFMQGTSMFGLFWDHTRWTSAVRWIEFTETGIATNYCRLETEQHPIKANTIDYRHLALRNGMFGITVIYSPAHNGEFILVPTHVIAKSIIEKNIQEGLHLEKTSESIVKGDR